MNKKVLIEALGRPWFIEPQSAAYYASIVHKLFTGQPISEFETESKQEYAWAVDAAGKRIGSVEDAVNNGVAVINLRGAVMKYDYCGAPGTQSLIKAIQQANDNPSISSIVLQIDSPGGSVDGTQQMANAVKESKKPVVAYINGMMASAAMWIGSAAKERIASSNTDTIGSIGTMAKWADYKGYYEKEGVTIHEVYATDSTHKNHQFREASDGNYEPMIKTWLDPLNNEFIGNVKENLPGVDQTVFNGSHYIATEAKKKGLIDRIGTFDMAVKTAIKLGKQQQFNSNKMAFEQTLSAAQAESFEVVEGGFLLSEDHLNNIEATIAAAAAQKAEIETHLQAVQSGLAETESTLDAANEVIVKKDELIASLEAQIADLKKAPAASFSTTTKEKDEVGATENKYTHPVNEEAARLRAMRGLN